MGMNESFSAKAVVLSGRVYNGMLKHYMNQSSTLQGVCAGPVLDLSSLLCGTGPWMIRSPLQRKLGVCWGTSGRCSLDRLSLAL